MWEFITTGITKFRTKFLISLLFIKKCKMLYKVRNIVIPQGGLHSFYPNPLTVS